MATISMDAKEVMTRTTELKKFWGPRNNKLKEYYRTLEMVDLLERSGMESFVGNDPRSSFNLVLHMLDDEIPHRIPSDYITIENLDMASKIEKTYRYYWNQVYKSHRKKGRAGFKRDFIGLLLATGWYSLFSEISPDGTKCIVEVWNPADVYPNWEDGLVEVAHIFTVTQRQATALCERNGYNVNLASKGNNEIRDYWCVDTTGNVYNAILINKKEAKGLEMMSQFDEIPIYVGVTGGLPDTGQLGDKADSWKQEIGQPMIATNANIYKAWNKWWTFSMQLLRDTAQPRWKEKSRSAKPILKESEMNKRGAIFRMTPDEDVSPLETNPIPVEIRSSQLDMEAMMQRGGPSWAAQGNMQGQITSYMMSQIISSTAQIAKPYHQAIVDALSDIDNQWYRMISKHGYKPYEMGLPKIPAGIEISADYEIKIPGDLIQRATTAKMLDPNFKMSYRRTVEMLFPEVSNPILEMANVMADDAQRNPVNAALALITHLTKQAEMARKKRDAAGAQRIEAAIKAIEASMMPQGTQTQAAAPTPSAPGITGQMAPPTGAGAEMSRGTGAESTEGE